MRKRIAVVLIMAIFLSMVPNASATTGEVSIVVDINDKNNPYVTWETISDEELSQRIPTELYEKLERMSGSENGGVTTYGTSWPSRNDQYDLSKGKYNFTVLTKTDWVYSNYVFVGHGGSVTFHGDPDESCIDGDRRYWVEIYVKGWLGNTVVGGHAMNRVLGESFTVTGLNEGDLVFFGVDPQSRLLELTSSSYIKAGG